jgi:hypothetical protein
MSFDLYVFDIDDIPDDEEALGELIEDENRWDVPPTGRLRAFIDDLEKHYPSLDDDPEGSPWASWPLGDTVVDGHGACFNIVWSHADRMSQAIRSACREAGLILYDPQDSQIIRPS